MNSVSQPRHSRSVRANGPDPVDVHVGRRVKLRRVLLDMSQTQLAENIGLTFQQVQKYEKGANRISASMLHRLAQALDVPVSFFFDDMSDGLPRLPAPPADPMTRTESEDLIRDYYGLPKPVRRQLQQLVKTIAQHGRVIG